MTRSSKALARIKTFLWVWMHDASVRMSQNGSCDINAIWLHYICAGGSKSEGFQVITCIYEDRTDWVSHSCITTKNVRLCILNWLEFVMGKRREISTAVNREVRILTPIQSQFWLYLPCLLLTTPRRSAAQREECTQLQLRKCELIPHFEAHDTLLLLASYISSSDCSPPWKLQ